MQSAFPTARPAARSVPALAHLTIAEGVALAFFGYLALLGFLRPLSPGQRLVLCCLPVVFWAAWRIEAASRRPWSRVVREWSYLALILIGYWLLEWFATRPLDSLQARFLSWDRLLLYSFGFRSLVEVGGAAAAGVLETVYLLLYAVPATAVGVLYACGARRWIGRYLLVLFLGTFSAYALLPLIPVISPRVAFPAQDLPSFSGSSRQINTWVLDNLDISTGVFPSGHVAVGFSSAFGLLAVFRERRRIWMPAFIMAVLVYAATIYGRYHYAVDGLASILCACAAWRIAEACRCDE